MKQMNFCSLSVNNLLNFMALMACTINLHLHCHLRECIIDYGPVYAFWLFSDEPLNGILGNFHTNNHDIALQLMRKYLIEIDTAPHNWPSEYRDDFMDLIHSHRYCKGSLMSNNLEMALATNNHYILSLPPIHECITLF